MRKKLIGFVATLTVALLISATAQADSWSGQVVSALKEYRTIDDSTTPQSILLAFKQDPATEDGFEAACISMQLAMLMQRSGAYVTIFATLGGARLADQQMLERDKRMCKTSTGQAPLLGLVNSFLALGGGVDRIIVCPVCWMTRYGSEQDAMDNMLEGAILGDAEIMGAMFLGADKILDF